jgi:hypothetical protein
MTLVDADRSAHLYSRITKPTQTSGGSAANTAYGLASLGGRAGFIGKIAEDDLGSVFGRDMKEVGVGFHPGATSTTEPTGRCIIAVTPDGQRSMSTFLGAASLHIAHFGRGRTFDFVTQNGATNQADGCGQCVAVTFTYGVTHHPASDGAHGRTGT